MKKKASSKKQLPQARKGKPTAKLAIKPATSAAAKKSSTKPPVKSTPKSAKSAKPKKPAAPDREADLDPDLNPDPDEALFLESLLLKARAPHAPAAGNTDGDDALEAEIRAAMDASAFREEEKGLGKGLDKVMASLTQIFGGKDFLSDAELDALLDSKIASGEIPPSAALDPLDEAQSLIYEAWNSEGPLKIELARRALDMSKDCADAYVILAESDSKTQEAALALYRKGVEAGQRAIEPGVFKKSAGNFWLIMETRPYMRARLGLAECLWDLGKKEESLGHLRDLLRLNPSDNQGVRYILLQCLLESGADEELGGLLDRYGEDTSPEIRFTHALWLFRRQGPGPVADACLREALQANSHVPFYLLKKRKIPNRIPSSARIGSQEEAEAYASGAFDTWYGTLGALDWLASQSGS